jgi:phage terminase small subunit
LFLEAYLGTASGNATEAARVAGYRGDEATLAQMGHENLRKPQIARAVEVRLQRAAMETDEILSELSRVARLDPSAPGLASAKVRALEVLAKINGLTSDRPPLLSRGELVRQLDEVLDWVAQQAAPRQLG